MLYKELEFKSSTSKNNSLSPLQTEKAYLLSLCFSKSFLLNFIFFKRILLENAAFLTPHVSLLTIRVKTSDLFERWRNLQVCKWEQSKEETSNFK